MSGQRTRGAVLRVAAVAMGLALAGTAGAADLPLRGSQLDSADDLLANAPEIEAGGFWYLRGDAGYVFDEAPDWALGGSPDDAGLIGIGIGARFSDWLRADVTADYRTPAAYDASGFAGELSAVNLLANVYLDLGRWQGRFTPYVGAGVGGAYVDYSAPGAGSGWGLAWAGMAGVAIDLAPNWQLDLGYRYLKYENVSLGNGLPDFDQAANEIRIGVRYLIP